MTSTGGVTMRRDVWGLPLGLALLASAAAGATSVPWPRGRPPTPIELDETVSDAVELYDQERYEEYLEAYERGEDSEHVFLLQTWIDQGRYSVEKLFTFGDGAFEHDFQELDGYGDGSGRNLKRVHEGTYGGRDAHSCAGCHQLGGANGSGNVTANGFYFGDGEAIGSAVVRNPPAVLGLGYVQALAAEMTGVLTKLRRDAAAKAESSGEPVLVQLQAKGVDFGRIVVRPDGTIDDTELEGVDPDLVVRPFGWKGHTARLRRFAERAARIHFGIQSHVLAEQHQEDPQPERMGWGPNWWDPDGDGHQRELEEGILTAMAVYMALLEVPVIIPPTDAELRERWADGSALFDRIGCTECHRRKMTLNRLEWTETPDSAGSKPVTIHLVTDGEAPRSPGEVNLFSDLKRHDMGDDLADANEGPDGVARNVFITRPLWGVAETPPYLHDGRAATLLDAIRWHGGEAATARSTFEELTATQRQNLHIFLLSLTRQPKLKVAQ